MNTIFPERHYFFNNHYKKDFIYDNHVTSVVAPPARHAVKRKHHNKDCQFSCTRSLFKSKKSNKLDIFNMFCKGVLLLYPFRLQRSANLITCSLEHKIVTFIEIKNVPDCHLDHIKNEQKLQQSQGQLQSERNARYTLHLS